MNRIDFFKDVKFRCTIVLERDLNLIPLKWVISQLNYLIDLEEGLPVDLFYKEN